jgi:hypothetical protein
VCVFFIPFHELCKAFQERVVNLCAELAIALLIDSCAITSIMQDQANGTSPRQSVCNVDGPIIVGAGPSGLAVAATLRKHSVPFTILERSDGIADLWTNRTYGRLRLHLPKVFCELPHVRFPPDFPAYPSKHDFLRYLHSYADHFSISPLFGRTVTRARFDAATSLWHVTAAVEGGEVTEFVSRWLVVASGENAEVVVPKMKGRERFAGEVLHSSEYKSGERFKGKRVLVVGCGNSGMEMCLDLCEHGAIPFMSVRSGVSQVSPCRYGFLLILCPMLACFKSTLCQVSIVFLFSFLEHVVTLAVLSDDISY